MVNYKFNFNKRKKSKRRKSSGKKTSVGHVKSLIKQELGKTRESLKLLSFINNLPIRSINEANPWRQTIVYSLTGGQLASGETTSQDPLVETQKTLFPLRPMFSSAGVDAVTGAGQGGVATDSGASVQTQVHTGVNTLRGTNCWLRRFRANIIISNQGDPTFTTPGGDDIPATNPQSPVAQFVRLVVFETRRPLGNNNLNLQMFLQGTGGDDVNPPANDSKSNTTCGFLNLSVIKKVYHDRLFWLNDGDKGGTNSNKVIRLNIPLNKKAYWTNVYTDTQPLITYGGPYIYMVMLASNEATQNLEVAPRMSMTSMLTYYDD